jgi:hypothetical protein
MQDSNRGIALAGTRVRDHLDIPIILFGFNTAAKNGVGPEVIGKENTRRGRQASEAVSRKRRELRRDHGVRPAWKMLLGVPVAFLINMAADLGRYTGRSQPSCHFSSTREVRQQDG